MEQFLDRLGLADLRIAQLEQTLDSPIEQQRKDRLAKELADMYAERLMASADEKGRYEDTLSRISRLLSRFPQANTTALQVMLLQADYNRAETLITKWISQPQETAARDEARQILERITPQLVTLQARLNEQVKTLYAAMEDLPEGDQLQAKEVELKRVQGVTARATYFAGWSNYYLGLAQQAAAGSAPYTTARNIFLRLLDLENSQPEDWEAEWFGLQSIWRARAVIGLGLSLAACGDLVGSERCFTILEHRSAPSEIREQAPYWFVRALLDAGQWDQAEGYAQGKINSYQPPPTQGQVSLCVALVRAGYGPGVTGSRERRQLGDLGLLGLARLGQLGAINELIDKYQIKTDANSGFVLFWATGQKQFAAAEKSKSAADYQAAANTLQKALRSPETQGLAGPAARCRYTLGWCYFRLDKLEEAATEFSQAFPGLNESKDELAVEAAWMAFAAYRKLADSTPRFATKASDAQRRLQQNFPTHPYTQRATYELTKLMEKSDPETMIAQLEALQPGDENYALARSDLCFLLHRLWNKERGNGAQATKRVKQLRAAVDKSLATVSGNDPEDQLKLCLLAADAALHNTPPQLDIATGMLTRAERFATGLPNEQSQVAELHYRLLELAAAQGDDRQRRQQAQWIADNAQGTRYEQAALVIVAQALDRQIREATPDARAGLLPQAYSVYSRLVEVLGASQDALASSRNAQVALSRLADYTQQLGRSAEAANRLDQLLEAHPRNKQYLQRAVNAHLQAGQSPQALRHVRTLLAGLPSSSDQWYQAKYWQLEALSRTDPQQAQKVYRQFQLLHPNLGGTAWKAKFTELARSW
jgi:tetratricopeptide (TPR) repeat protein